MKLRQHCIAVSDRSHIGEVRRLATRLGADMGLDATQAGRGAIVAMELATNITQHAGSGEILLRQVEESDKPQLEVLAIDRGRGMANVAQCLRDGFSTAGTAGNGLGAVKRLSAVFDIYSDPGQGTVVLARVGGAAPGGQPELGVVSLPLRGEIVCGDGWRFQRDGRAFTLTVVDGLGHGLQAAEAADLALATAPAATPVDTIALAHEKMRTSRGGALAVAMLDRAGATLRYAGVGNIAGSLVGEGRPQSLVSHNGTVGAQMRKTQEFSYPWPGRGVLVMHSDGLGTRWQLSNYPGLQASHPAVVAAVLYRDHARGRDDVTVTVVSEHVH